MPEGHDDERSTFIRKGPPLAPLRSFGCVVRVVAGPDKGKELRFEPTRGTRIHIGQSAASDIPLTDREVSRRHASIDLGERPRIIDLGSTNGSTLDGVAFVEAFIRGGELLRIGASTLRIDLVESDGVTMISPATAFGRLLGVSNEMRRLFPVLERVAVSNVSILIEGETGTGKELLAESIHEVSLRAEGPFVVFDCTAVPPTLLESALFGHERGAFTGATRQRKGVFEQAHRGTLLIDEIGDLDISLQPKLLRALQNGQVQRLGSNVWTPVDVRVLAATRRDLDKMIQAGRFRDDLFFRLAVARVELPALRHRGSDVPMLAAVFWRQLGGAGSVPEDFLESLSEYPWPGNVRELYNAVAHRVVLGVTVPGGRGMTKSPNSARLHDEDPTPAEPKSTIDLAALGVADLPLTRARQVVVGEFERYYVEKALERHGGNVVRAAEAAGIARRYFHLLRARQR